ncbi:HAD-like domain-containing protein [Amylostereum chailletii]|nr:HAD-like domain-containing protein [Amylostereum chailletii]
MDTNFIPRCTTLILDIGDVLVTWSPKTPTSIAPRTLLDITSSSIWAKFESGKLTQSECYRLVAAEYSIDVEQLERAFEHARDSLQPNHDFISFIRTIKAEGALRVFAMSNISSSDYEALRMKLVDWSIFDEVFTSAAAGMRKPDLCFYKHVLKTTGSDPQSTLFVDDKLENVLSARSLGMQGVVFDKPESVRRTLRYLVSADPIRRGWDFLEANAGKLDSITDTGLVIGDNFAQLLILEATNERKLVNLVDRPQAGKWNFFRATPHQAEFPLDLDTTSIGLTVLPRDRDVVNSVLDEMLQYRNEDGIVLLYFDHTRVRMDPVVCVNVLSLFYSYDRGTELATTQNWVFDVLKHQAYLDGTRYYTTAETFLFFLARLVKRTAAKEEVQRLFLPLLKERLQERVGAPGDAMALAMRIVACKSVGIRDEVDLRRLLSMQLEDGSWGPGNVYKYGRSGVGIGNHGLATALALEAIRAV